MDKIRVRGGAPLHGEIRIGGAKNAALPLMAAALLTEEALTLANLPDLADITALAHLLSRLGVEISANGKAALKLDQGREWSLSAGGLSNTVAPYDLVRKMRASVLVLGPLLARYGRARVSLPGGCAIGTRPVDLHLMGLAALGARIEIDQGYIDASAPQGLKGTLISLPSVSVGATENILMAATLAAGETVIENAAREPEIGDLARCLRRMGAEIEGIDTSRLVVRGVEALRGAEYEVLPDRIESGSYAVAAAITGGEVELAGARIELIGAVSEVLRHSGATVEATARGVKVARHGNAIEPVDVNTRPYPGFPTDMQAQVMALMTIARGTAVITETIFENRFMHVPELARMGADIAVTGHTAVVRGVEKLTSAQVMATDLRASMGLVLAGLAAEGDTVVNRVYHLDRGYELLVEKLSACGAEIERLHG